MKEVTVQELPALLQKETTLLIDVRDETAHKQGAIPGAKNIPINYLLDNLEELKTYTDLFIHCGGGTRSKRACQMLKDAGIKTAINVKGGLRSWKKTYG